MAVPAEAEVLVRGAADKELRGANPGLAEFRLLALVAGVLDRGVVDENVLGGDVFGVLVRFFVELGCPNGLVV